MTAIISNNRARWFFLQVVAFLLIIGFFGNIVHNVVQNVDERGLRTGFEFLSSEAGFPISETLISYDESNSYLRSFYVGIVNTLFVSVISVIFASILGLLIGVANFSNNWLVRKLAVGYVELFRNIPILLQILFWHNLILNIFPPPRQSFHFLDIIFINLRGIYLPGIIDWSNLLVLIFGLAGAIFAIFAINRSKKITASSKKIIKYALIFIPIIGYFLLGGTSFELPVLKGFNFQGGISISPELFALAFALSIYTATYIAEAVRSGIESVATGQKEAAQSLGLNHKQVLKFVVLPQALRVAIPPIISQYLNVVKNSSLAVAIGYPDLVNVFTGTALNQVGQALEIIAMTMLVYLIISLLISLVLNWVNAKYKIIER